MKSINFGWLKEFETPRSDSRMCAELRWRKWEYAAPPATRSATC